MRPILFAICLSLILVFAEKSEAPKPESIQTNTLELHVSDSASENGVYRDLVLSDESGKEVCRIEYAILRNISDPDIELTRNALGWELRTYDSLGWGTGVSVTGWRRWQIIQGAQKLRAVPLPNEVTSSYCVSYKEVDGVEVEQIFELQGKPGAYDWVLVRSSSS